MRWGPTPDGTYHALEDPDARPLRKHSSLCGLRVECDDSLIVTTERGSILVAVPLTHGAVTRVCRACLEKLGDSNRVATPPDASGQKATDRA